MFNRLESATAKAFKKLSNTPGYDESRDADVKFYETLTPQAFDVIAATYGPEALTEYVKAMEIKRMRGSSNG